MTMFDIFLKLELFNAGSTGRTYSLFAIEACGRHFITVIVITSWAEKAFFT